MKYRKLTKMNYYNDSKRTLFESILSDHVLAALKTFISNNDLDDVILIGGLAVSYYSKPYISFDIDILVKCKKKFKYFPNNQYRNGIQLDVYDINDLGLTSEQFDDIKSHCIISDNFKIANASHLMSLFFRDHWKYMRCIGFLFDNCYINKDIIRKYSTDEEFKQYEFFLKYSKKNYRMNFVNKYDQFIKYKIFEGSTGIAQVDAAFRDWIINTTELNQVLIGGMAVFNYIQERTTDDVDFIFLSENELPIKVADFKKTRSHCFRHIPTHVEIETLTPKFLGVYPELLEIVFDTAFDKGKFKLASPSSIVALKLHRLSEKDLIDIKNLIENYQVDITSYIPFLSDIALDNLESLKTNFNFKL